jgi:hypothetical protein
MRLMDVMWVGLVLIVATALFILKYEVQGLEETELFRFWKPSGRS